MKELTVFDKAIFAHSQWKNRLRKAIETGETLEKEGEEGAAQLSK